MESLISLYKKRLNLPEAQFTFIDHEDAMVAAVFKISQPGNPDLILKVCSRQGDFLRESYFLNRFDGRIPVPKIVQLIEQESGLDAAVLMECIQGDLLKSETVTKALAWEIGSILARTHIEPTEGYGDLTDPSHLSRDSRIPFTMKFEERLEECKGHFVAKYLGKDKQNHNPWFIENVVDPLDAMIRIIPESIVAKNVSFFKTGPDLAS